MQYYMIWAALYWAATMAGVSASTHYFYTLKPLKLGVEIRGVDLKSDIAQEVVDQIQADIHLHRLLVFKDQGVISGDRHVEISQWFGELESTFHAHRHRRSPHKDVFRLSNDKSEGVTGVGVSKWHVDGNYRKKPFRYSLFHIVEGPSIGNTMFAPLTEIVEGLTDEDRERWERIWVCSNLKQNIIHPLVYPHPTTGKPTFIFHDKLQKMVWDYGTPDERWTNKTETSQFLAEIENQFAKNRDALVYSHKWERGDFIISDNLAVAHQATPETQWAPSKVGLRVLHRTTVKGTTSPTKQPGTQTARQRTVKPVHTGKEEL